jgi:hypothetical protein
MLRENQAIGTLIVNIEPVLAYELSIQFMAHAQS